MSTEQPPKHSSLTARERVIDRDRNFASLAFQKPMEAKPGYKSILVEATGDPALDRQRLTPYRNIDDMYGGVIFEEIGEGAVNVQVPMEASDDWADYVQRKGLAQLESVRDDPIAKTIHTISQEQEVYKPETVKNMGRNLPPEDKRPKEPLPPLSKTGS